MKSHRPTLIIAGLVLLIAGWLLSRPDRFGGGARVSPPPLEAPPASSALFDPPDEAVDPQWLARHTAGITFHQRNEEIGYYPGSIALGSAVGDLGETPPMFNYQLRTSRKPIILGELDDRHKYERSVYTVNLSPGKVETVVEIWVTFPQFAKTGGFVFRREQDPITEVGIIIPEVAVPPGLETSESHSIEVRYHDRWVDPEEFVKLPTQPLGDNDIVLMGVPGMLPPSVRVLWMRFDENGSLSPALSK